MKVYGCLQVCGTSYSQQEQFKKDCGHEESSLTTWSGGGPYKLASDHEEGKTRSFDPVPMRTMGLSEWQRPHQLDT